MCSLLLGRGKSLSGQKNDELKGCENVLVFVHTVLPERTFKLHLKFVEQTHNEDQLRNYAVYM